MFNDPVITAYITFVAVVVGLVMGSFINCWAWRYVNGESVAKGRSHCTSCGHELGVRDLVPVFSWLASGGKCRYCGEKVSARYPATEIVCAACFGAIAFKYGFSLETLELIAFAGILLGLSLVDIDKRIIPNGCIIAAIAVRAAYLAYACATGIETWQGAGFYLASGAGMGLVLVVFTLVANHVFGRSSMGGGDLKLYAVAGFYFGWQQGFFLVILSCIIGIVVAAVTSGKGSAGEREAPQEDAAAAQAALQASSSDEQAASQESDSNEQTSSQQGSADSSEDEKDVGFMKRTIPFGPSIAAACIITMLVGKSVLSWYIGLL